MPTLCYLCAHSPPWPGFSWVVFSAEGSSMASSQCVPWEPHCLVQGPARAAWPSFLVLGLLQCESKSGYCIALFPFTPGSFGKHPFSCCCLAVWQQNKCLYLRDLKICLLLHVFQSLSRIKFSPLE